MVKRTATEWKRKGIEGCSYFLMEEVAEVQGLVEAGLEMEVELLLLVVDL